MSDPVFSFILVITFILALSAASWFKTLDGTLWQEARVPLICGGIAGLLIHFASSRLAGSQAIIIGVVLTVAALYVRLTGRESEPSDGMVLGAMTGVGASAPLVLLEPDAALLRFSSCVLAGAMAGYGITFGLSHVRDRVRQLVVDLFTVAAAVCVAALPALLLRFRLTERQIAIASALLLPLLAIATVFKQWPAIREELQHEASLGVIDGEDVRPTAHPLRRLTRTGWHDASAHREFVRIANKIALRKRQQRGRPEQTARLYQLEVIKLRMELQEMTSIDRAMRSRSLEELTPQS